MQENLIIGSHVSFTNKEQLLGAVNEALLYGANTFMFYTGAPQNTKRGVIDDTITKKAHELMQEKHINIKNVIIHAPYIINLANPLKQEFSVSFLKEELQRANLLGIKRVVLHPGSAVGNPRDVALQNIINGLNLVLDNDNDVTILIETMAGKGSELGINLDEISAIITNVKYPEKIGVCLDTCHLSDSGVDISRFDEYLNKFAQRLDLDLIKCIHINDSKNPCGSHTDRHENIGFGTIGFSNLINVIYHEKLKNVPKILETPYVSKITNPKEKIYPPYKYEIKMIREKKFDSELLNKIRDNS